MSKSQIAARLVKDMMRLGLKRSDALKLVAVTWTETNGSKSAAQSQEK